MLLLYIVSLKRKIKKKVLNVNLHITSLLSLFIWRTRTVDNIISYCSQQWNNKRSYCINSPVGTDSTDLPILMGIAYKYHLTEHSLTDRHKQRCNKKGLSLFYNAGNRRKEVFSVWFRSYFCCNHICAHHRFSWAQPRVVVTYVEYRHRSWSRRRQMSAFL